MKIKKELLDKLNEYLELREELKSGYGVDNSDESANIENNINYITNQIKRKYAETIAKLAYNNQLSTTHKGIVYINLETGELEGESLTTNTVIEDESLYKIFELHNNWIANNNWKSMDIVSHEEWKELQKRYGNEANFLDAQQLESININLDDRIIEYLEWSIQKND